MGLGVNFMLEAVLGISVLNWTVIPVFVHNVLVTVWCYWKLVRHAAMNVQTWDNRREVFCAIKPSRHGVKSGTIKIVRFSPTVECADVKMRSTSHSTAFPPGTKRRLKLVEAIRRALDWRVGRKTMWRCSCWTSLCLRIFVLLAVRMRILMWVHRLLAPAKMIFLPSIWLNAKTAYQYACSRACTFAQTSRL